MPIFLVVCALAAVGFAFWMYRGGRLGGPPRPEPTEVETPKPARPVPPAKKPDHKPRAEKPAPPAPVPEAAAPKKGGRIALVIDDLGRSVEDVRRLGRLAVPLSYAVLPFERATAEVVAALAEERREILCHLPMSPDGGANPGPGALTEDMGPAELARATRAALDAVPGAVGVNNHMGSRLSADRRALEPILAVVAERGLFFLDSRTSPESVAYRTARQLGIPAAERQVFLDPDQSPEAVRFQFERLVDLARERGAAIGIGHPHPVTLEVLAAEIPKARAAGLEFVPVSYLVDDPGGPPE